MKSACLVMLTLFVSLSSVCENLKESNSLQDRKKLSFVERLAKYVEDNAEYFANLHCLCSGDFHARF